MPPVVPQPARLTRQELEAGKTPAGGYNRRQLALWGIPWPPPKGWQQQLLGDTEGRPQAEPGGRIVMRARGESTCAGCQQVIVPGEWISLDSLGEWVHRTCLPG